MPDDASLESHGTAGDRRFFLFTALLSVLALSFLVWLLILRPESAGETNLRFMPAVNAGWNTVATAFLTLGYIAIRRGRRDLHRGCMLAAFVASTLFLVGYIAYHYAHGDTHYEGGMRGLYLSILASHVILSMGIVPLALTTFYFAWRRRFRAHRRVARITLPIWLYVSVTGVLIYFMLHG